MGENRVIARNGNLPWRLPGDLKMFKRRTMGNPVVMGRRTFNSIGNKPLPKRTNIVLTRQSGLAATPKTKIAHDLDQAIALANEAPSKTRECFIVGGADIYAQSLPLAKRLYVTLVHGKPPGDLLFPAFNCDDWQIVFAALHEQGEEDSQPWSEYILEPRT